MHSAAITVAILLMLAGITLTVLNLQGMLLIFSVVTLLALFSGFRLVGGETVLIAALAAAVTDGGEMFMRRRSDYFRAQGVSIGTTIVGIALFVFLLTPFLYGLGLVLGVFLGPLLSVVANTLPMRRKGRPVHREKGAAVKYLLRTAARGLISVAVVVGVMIGMYS